MRVSLINIPNTRRNAGGQVVQVGPQAGSRWPFLGMVPGCYAPAPFFMLFAASYLQAYGVEVDVLDFVAMGKWQPWEWNFEAIKSRPDIVCYEMSMPVRADVLSEAETMKSLGKTVVLCGPHCASEGEQLAALPYVDHVIIGEYEIPLLKICRGDKTKLFRYEHVDNLDTANGQPWHPYRDMALIDQYYEPTIDTPKTQLTVSTSRGCAWHCHYCQWQKVMNNKTYRTRSVETVMDEIASAIAASKRTVRMLGHTWMTMKNRPDDSVEVRSILFDDDTWNLGGPKRINAMCAGLKRIGLPWSMMGRLDAHAPELFDTMVDAGAVAFRFGVETFHQPSLDLTGGRRNAVRQYESAKHILTRFSGLEVHFTSMRHMGGHTAEAIARDDAMFQELETIGAIHGNKVHRQCSSMMPFPGTDIYEEMRAAGHGDLLGRADYNGTGCDEALNAAVREFVPLSVKGK